MLDSESLDIYKAQSQPQDVQKYAQNSDSKLSDEIEENLNQIQEIVVLLAQSIKENEDQQIFDYLNQMYMFNSCFAYTKNIFNNELFYFIFSNCITNESEEIINISLKVLNNLIKNKVDEFTEIMFSTNLPQLVIDLFSSANMHIKCKSLSTICILSQLDPQKSLFFWDSMLATIDGDIVDIILSYIYNCILYWYQNPDFSIDQLQEIFNIINFAVFESDNRQAKFDALKIISRIIKDSSNPEPFINEYRKQEWISFFVEMINLTGRRSKSIEYGYSILKELIPYLDLDDIEKYKILNIDSIAKHLSYDIDDHGEPMLPLNLIYDIPIVKECLQFLCQLFTEFSELISEILESDDDEVITEIFIITLHSTFKIRDVSSQLLCLFIRKGSKIQIISLPLNLTIQTLFNILESDQKNSENVIESIKRVVRASLVNGCTADDIQSLFYEYNANEIFQNLIQEHDELEEKIILLCNTIDFELY